MKAELDLSDDRILETVEAVDGDGISETDLAESELDSGWVTETKRMVDRGFAAFCKRRGINPQIEGWDTNNFYFGQYTRDRNEQRAN